MTPSTTGLRVEFDQRNLSGIGRVRNQPRRTLALSLLRKHMDLVYFACFNFWESLQTHYWKSYTRWTMCSQDSAFCPHTSSR